MGTALLPDRAVLGLEGVEARAFLDRIVTCGVDAVAPDRGAYGALLSPQGKILADFVLLAADGSGERFLLDAPAAAAPDLLKRLGLYRLRAKVALTDLSADHRVLAGWDGGASPSEALAAAPDPRLPELGWRAVVPAGIAGDPDGAAAYAAHRVTLGVPAGGVDFAFGDAFPHEALMDQLGGVDFGKGCYVGQEVVSRMQHRGTARTRVVALAYDGEAPPPGTAVTAGERALGTTGSVADGRGLALIRLDRAGEALAAGEPIRAGGAALRFAKPAWIRFPYPGESPTASGPVA